MDAEMYVMTMVLFVEGEWVIGQSVLGYPQIVIVRMAELDEIPNTEDGVSECVLA